MKQSIDRLIRKQDKEKFIYQGIERTYLYYSPKCVDSSITLPLVIILHGGGANAENAMRMADMEALAEDENFILLYPDGSGLETDRVYTWNAGHCCGYAKESNCDDVGFLESLIDFFIDKHSVDPKRVYVAGFSNGAMMTYRFACEASDKITAIAAVSGALGFFDKKPNNSIPLISFHGAEDEHAPLDGGLGKKTRYKRVDRPVLEGILYWAKNNNCYLTPSREVSENIIKEVYGGEFPVVNYVILNQGHAWPGGKEGLRYGNADKPTDEISATDLMWEFFKNHSR